MSGAWATPPVRHLDELDLAQFKASVLQDVELKWFQLNEESTGGTVQMQLRQLQDDCARLSSQQQNSEVTFLKEVEILRIEHNRLVGALQDLRAAPPTTVTQVIASGSLEDDPRYEELAHAVEDLRDAYLQDRALARQAPPTESGSGLSRLEELVDAESQRRGRLIAELHERLAREMAEVSRQLEQHSQELLQRIQEESRAREAAIAALSSSAAAAARGSASAAVPAPPADGRSSTSAEYEQLAAQIIQERRERLLGAAAARVEVDRALQGERDERALQAKELLSEVSRTLEGEREARLQLAADLTAALSRDRDERRADSAGQRAQTAKLLAMWHARMEAVDHNRLASELRQQGADGAGEATGTSGMFSRLFQRHTTPSEGALSPSAAQQRQE